MKLTIQNNNLPQTTKIRYKLLALVQQFIKAAKGGEILTSEGNKYSKGTLRTYRTFLLTIEKYEEKFGTVYIDEINIQWAEYYKVFLTNLGMTKNSISTNMSKLKSILNRAYNAGITLRSGYGIRISREVTTQVYLTWSELSKLYHYNFENIGERRVRDVFIMHCFLGMRISDFLEFVQNPKKYIKNVDGLEIVEYHSKKTGIKSVVPIHTMVNKILKENDYNFGTKFSYQHYNLYLKKISKIAEINEVVNLVYTKAGEKVEKESVKYNLISSHTARRTFASLAELAKIDRPSIMKITGHKTEQAFTSYIRITELDSAMNIYDHEFFKREL